MKRRQILLFLSSALASLLLAVGLHLRTPTSAYSQQGNLLVSAAASLKEVLEELRPTFQRANPGVTVTFNFGASGALLQQIQQGAPADVFISAAKRQMDTLDQSGGLVPGTRGNLANNRMVLIAPKDAKTVTSFQSLTRPEVKRISVGEPRSVPAGQYAEEVLRNLKLLDQLKPKFVFGNNVRQVLAAVESGNADAGMVYVTDAKISDRVRTVAVADEKLHSPIVYPMAVLKDSKNQNAARAYLRFLSSTQARTVLRKYGFIVPR